MTWMSGKYRASMFSISRKHSPIPLRITNSDIPFMKRIFSFALSLITALTACGNDAPKPAPSGKNQDMILATYNLRVPTAADETAGNGWDVRLPQMTKVIKKHGFEIFGTQEGVKAGLDALQTNLAGYKYIGVGRDNGAEQGEHAAIFYDTKKFDLLDSGNFWLSETPDQPSFGWDAACRRICTWGKFRHKSSGFTFVYFNLHMDHKGVVARRESCNLIFSKIKAFPQKLPVILSGDFNIDQMDEGYKLLQNSGIMKDSYTMAGLRDITTPTYNGYNYKRADKSTDGNFTRIDHIFLSPEFKVTTYRVPVDTYTTKETDGTDKVRTPSDHFPVVLKLSVPTLK